MIRISPKWVPADFDVLSWCMTKISAHKSAMTDCTYIKQREPKANMGAPKKVNRMSVQSNQVFELCMLLERQLHVAEICAWIMNAQLSGGQQDSCVTGRCRRRCSAAASPE
mmetsp:Transcript_40109/g.66556  ORF Transcript_40109/g.66556 Transcript_40109/m.66556 type:complete len:111 (+) Transcript_40109:286-618(+)